MWSKSSVRTSAGRWTSTCCWASSCFGGARASQSSIGRGSGCSSPKIRTRRRHHAGPTCERSEEHTSELQSLMRISYAVFCLQNNKNNPPLPLPTLTHQYYTTHPCSLTANLIPTFHTTHT